MIITATQAQLFPPLYMFVRFAMCERVILMQEAQYSAKGGHSRLIFKAGDAPEYITLPVQGRGRKPIQEVTVAQQGMWDFHNVLKVRYGKYPKFNNFFHFIVTHTNKDPVNLHDFNSHVIKTLAGMLAINCTFTNSKELIPFRADNATKWLSDLAEACHATHYIQGKAGIDSYFEMEHFQAKKISVMAQDTKSDLPIGESVLNFLFQYGLTETKRIVKELSFQHPLLIGNFHV